MLASQRLAFTATIVDSNPRSQQPAFTATIVRQQTFTTSSDHLYSEQQSRQAQRLLSLFTNNFDFTRQGVEQTSRFTLCSRHRLHTTRGGAAYDLRLRAHDIDSTCSELINDSTCFDLDSTHFKINNSSIFFDNNIDFDNRFKLNSLQRFRSK